GAAVDAEEAIPRVDAPRAHRVEVAVVVAQRVGDEEQVVDRPEERSHLPLQERDALRRPVAARAEEDAHGKGLRPPRHAAGGVRYNDEAPRPTQGGLA